MTFMLVMSVCRLVWAVVWAHAYSQLWMVEGMLSFMHFFVYFHSFEAVEVGYRHESIAGHCDAGSTTGPLFYFHHGKQY